MTATTTSAREAHTREHRTASALHELADLYYAGSIPESKHADVLPLEIPLSLATADAVAEFADRMGVHLTTYTDTHGALHTRATLRLGDVGAVELNVVHVGPDVEAV